MKIFTYICFEIGIFFILIGVTRSLTSEYRGKIYDIFIPMGTEVFEFISYTMRILTFILAAIFWCVLMCVRLYIKSLINKGNSQNCDLKTDKLGK